MSVRTIQANGIRIAYRFDGPETAPVVMLSNSLMADMSMWEPQMAALSAHFRVLRADTRGHGQTEVTPAPYSIALLAQDAIALLDALGIAKVHFVGLSKGGMIGQYLGARHPGRIASLTLCDTASEMPTHAMWDQRLQTAREAGTAGLVDGTLQRWFTPGFAQRAPQEIGKVRTMILGTPVEGYIGCASAVRNMSQTGLLRDIHVPTHIIVGESDPACTVEQSRVLHEHIIGSTMAVLPDSAHLSNIEQPELFNRELLGFLELQLKK
ncbi:3-oxoadipate enol-lactonase [Lacisediminimonas sp.]|uniref:3-oxoadipate enol-lactonase n=1 Tax=Lacisediminimonas sp. TaxID=3060582 RepID=UPI00271632FF|nr:3-oxoadipate enol-lactonase [Lacisediminimonas sp.]MDO8298248.1 3-oxoadipate enol-lactonase [Lacisediminimonas sp.]MDO9217475.1 3-oxoadipate enol-lactonase [Lacisediminimonas sp.]